MQGIPCAAHLHSVLAAGAVAMGSTGPLATARPALSRVGAPRARVA